jgi:hypothetical protein
MNTYQKIAFVILVATVAGCKDMGTEPVQPDAPLPPAGTTVSFSQHVVPILQRHGCTGCHGGSGGLTVSSVSALQTGGAHGAAIVAGQASNSILIQKLIAPPPFGSRMPQGGPYLPDSTINVLRSWIDQGALNN